MKVKNASLLSKEEYESNGSIPMVCGGYWLGTSAPDGKMYFVWSDTHSAICSTISPDARLGIRPVLTVDGLESAAKDEHGLVEYGGEKWHILSQNRIISGNILGLCEFSRAKSTDISRSDAMCYIREELLPELEKKEPVCDTVYASEEPAATDDVSVRPTIIEEIGRKPYDSYGAYDDGGFV